MVKDYVVFDLETTGLSPDKDTIIEIGALKVIQGKVADRFSEFINPHQKLTQQISELTGITDDMLAGARNLQVVGEILSIFAKIMWLSVIIWGLIIVLPKWLPKSTICLLSMRVLIL